MHSSSQTDIKQLILMSWKDRWSEKEWSKHARKYLQTPSDIFHVADSLVSQAFVGTSPNSLLVKYIWYGISTGLFSYASIITAISKHDDLHKIESTKELYRLLSECLALINKFCLVEDSMDLCCSLRMILQWLLTNTETYLKGMANAFAPNAEELLRINCQILKEITTGHRTSVLLTIARFEESGVWSHIETDLAVIQTSAGQHPLHVEIAESCHCVSQLSRFSTSPRAIAPIKSNYSVSFPISILFSLEVQCRKYSDCEGIASQLAILAQIHDFSLSDLIFQSLRSCCLGFLDAVESGDDAEFDWSAMIFLRMPKILSYIKNMQNDKIDSFGSSNSQKPDKFEVSLFETLVRLKALDSLIDSLDQLRKDMHWIKDITEVFLQHNLISNKSNIQTLLQLQPNKPHFDVDKCQSPLNVFIVERAFDSFLSALNPGIFSLDPDRILRNFQSLSPLNKFFMYASTAAATGRLSSLASLLFKVNDAMKLSSTDNAKTAQIRAALFDVSFLMTCYLAKLYGKRRILSSLSTSDESTLYAANWIDKYWLDSVISYSSVQYQTPANKKEIVIQILRNSNDPQLIQTDWSDIASTLSHAILDLSKEKVLGHITASDFTRICQKVIDCYPLSISVAVIAVMANHTRISQGSCDFATVLDVLTNRSPLQSQAIPLYDERFEFYKRIIKFLVSDFLPETTSPPNNCRITPNRSAVTILHEAIAECTKNGWINSSSLEKILFSYRYLGVASSTRQLVTQLLQESRLAPVEAFFDLIYSIFRIDVDSFIIYLMRVGFQKHFLAAPHILVAPVGPLLAQLMVSCLNNALNDRILRQKSLLKGEKLSPFIYEASPERKRDSFLKVRRLLSCSAEHDLSSSGNTSELPLDDPLLIVFSDFIQKLWDLVVMKDSKIIKDFVLTFVRLCLFSSSLLSRSMKEFMPTPMVKSFSLMLTKESRELLFAASDLGNPEIRRIAADAICLVETDS